jgi:hypothetical protein
LNLFLNVSPDIIYQCYVQAFTMAFEQS